MDLLISFLLLLLFTYISIQALRSLLTRTTTFQKLPPGPAPLPIIGNLLELGTNPHKSLTKLANIYGPIMTLQLGQVTAIVVSSAETAKAVLSTHDQSLSNRAVPLAMTAQNHHRYSLPFLSVSPRWRDLRKICNNELFSNKVLDGSQDLRRQKLNDLLRDIRQSSVIGEAVDIGKAAFKTTINLLSNTVYSVDLVHSGTAGEFKDTVAGIMEEVGKPNVADYFPVLKKFDPLGIKRRNAVHFGKLLDVFQELVRQRVKLRETTGSTTHNDMLDSLLNISQHNSQEMDPEKIRRLSVASSCKSLLHHSRIQLHVCSEFIPNLGIFYLGIRGKYFIMSSGASSSSASSASSTTKTYSLFNSSTQTAAVKLDRSNYMFWEATVRPLIIGNRLFSHIDGVSVASPSHITVNDAKVPNPDFEEWFVVDNLLLGWLRNSMSMEIGAQLLHYTTAQALWNGARTLTNQIGLTWEELTSTLLTFETKLDQQNHFSTGSLQPTANIAQTEAEPKNSSSDKTPRAPSSSNECIIPFAVIPNGGEGGVKRSLNEVPQALLPVNSTVPSETSASASRGSTALSSPAVLHSDESSSSSFSNAVEASRDTHSTGNHMMGRDSNQAHSPSQESASSESNSGINFGSNLQRSDAAAQSIPPANPHQMVTRSQVGVFKPKLPYVGSLSTTNGGSNLSLIKEPNSKFTIYVDDILVTGSNSRYLADFTQRLNSVFALKDLGPLYYFLGIEVHRDQSGIYLNQSKYAQDVLKRFNMTGCASVTTPMLCFDVSDGMVLKDLFVAGSDTTSSTLEWGMAELLRNPKAMSKAKEEVEEIVGKGKAVEESDISRLPYLQAVVKETFRLHPAVPFLVPRRAETEVEVEGYTIPKGAQVLVNVWAIGRDPKLWENPQEFSPERFLGSEIDVKGRSFELTPFGAGRRICPGYPLALRILYLVLGSLINCYDWKLQGGIKAEDMNMDDKFGITLIKAQHLLAVPSLNN
ncbi:geraniol 8-hydroxylase-like [Senna tora]|uniref:Geraniol 8-hydroxylase-like n=1 Tax=Senna tora TaxID=362788 RepID=A0A834TTS5_9FABA|nr:geraniol 8-hydroxylase-like [Senna tora]